MANVKETAISGAQTVNSKVEETERDALPAQAKRYPSGTAALFEVREGKTVPLADDRNVKLINLSLADATVSVPDMSITLKDGKVAEKRVRVLALGSIEMPARYARRVLSAQEKRGGNPQFVVAPRDGDCKGETFNAYGQTWSTCPFGNCKTHGDLPPRVEWSIWQGQHLVARLGTEAAIKRFIQDFDQRNPVIMFGLAQVGRRADARRERMGLRTTRADSVY